MWPMGIGCGWWIRLEEGDSDPWLLDVAKCLDVAEWREFVWKN